MPQEATEEAFCLPFIAFLKKEYTESARSGKLLLLVILFCAIGIMNPAIAKLTPWLMETMSESLEETGMSIYEMYQKLKADEAKKLIRGGAPFAQISDKLCYDSVSSFNNAFKKQTGITPTEYMLQNRSVSL